MQASATTPSVTQLPADHANSKNMLWVGPLKRSQQPQIRLMAGVNSNQQTCYSYRLSEGKGPKADPKCAAGPHSHQRMWWVCLQKQNTTQNISMTAAVTHSRKLATGLANTYFLQNSRPPIDPSST